jgi:hypothetical protein
MYEPSTCTELTVVFCSGIGGGFGFAGEGEGGEGCWANATIAGTRKKSARNFRSMRLRSATDCLINAAAPTSQPGCGKSEEGKPCYGFRAAEFGN